MTKHLHKLKAHARLFHVQKEAAFALILIVLTFVLLAALPDTRQPFASSEVQFTDSSASGLAIVPASCPSTPDYAGECDPSPLCNLPSAVAALFGINCPEPPPNTCDNGASNYPTCTFPPNTCDNGASNYPTCTFPPNTCPIGYILGDDGVCVFNVCPSGYEQEGNQCVSITPACTPLNYCVGSTLWHRNATCSTSPIQACSNGCTAGGCIEVAPPGVVVWQVRPPLLNAGERANVSWQVTGVLSCEVTGNNGDGTGSNETGVWSGASGAQISSPITAQTIYTLTCIGLDDSTVTRSATVNITPIFQEL